jgi:hypothetical protein
MSGMDTPRQLPDELWAVIEPLLPVVVARGPGGRARADDRRIRDTILYGLWTLMPWRAVTAAGFGPWQAVYDRFMVPPRCCMGRAPADRVLHHPEPWDDPPVMATGIVHADCRLFFGGAGRDRTVDLLNAIQALSHLSYSPRALKYNLNLRRLSNLFVTGEASAVGFAPFNQTAREDEICAPWRPFNRPLTGSPLHKVQRTANDAILTVKIKRESENLGWISDP